MGVKVLSLFDGISCGRLAFERLGVKIDSYYASEISKPAIKCSKANWDDIIHIGDVTKVSYEGGKLSTEFGEYFTDFDIVIGGSPCQSFSSAMTLSGKEANGLDGKSSLFYHYLRILKEVQSHNPNVVWLLENVRMSKDNKAKLDDYLDVSGIYINSDLFSFQKRPRYYWTNLRVEDPIDKLVSFQDYKQTGDLSKYKVKRTPSRERMWSDGSGTGRGSCYNITNSEKVYCLTTKQDRCPNSGLVEYEDFCRYLTQEELEMAQTVPVGYTASLSYGQASEVLGNGWTVDVICHVLKNFKGGK